MKKGLWLGFVSAFLMSVYLLYLAHKVRYSLRHKATPALELPDVQSNEAALSVSFNFLKNLASAGFLLSAP